MMDIYYAFQVQSTDEGLMALLMQYDFESLEENEDHFIAYIRKDGLNDPLKEEIILLIQRFTSNFTIEEILPQNWNAIWEASFQPVIVDDFCQVRADFHAPIAGISYDLIINPKMAFGTGHHATTHMMIQSMSEVDFGHKTALDFGCGTGILAILASKLGAKHVDAVDIEHESYQNTIENCQINHAHNIVPFEGDIDVIPATTYDVILANINRNILLRCCEVLTRKTKSGGVLLLSGVLQEDADTVMATYTNNGWVKQNIQFRDGWSCALMVKS
ncbi:MAG: 50S ribosomal protein L11 methyltransferase [Saprospiraceae bacterium]